MIRFSNRQSHRHAHTIRHLSVCVPEVKEERQEKINGNICRSRFEMCSKNVERQRLMRGSTENVRMC